MLFANEINGFRNRAQRAGFTLPEGIEAVNLKARPILPPKVLQRIESSVFQGMMTETPTWEDIDWLLGETALPVIVKGILHPEDAKIDKEKGIAGVIVSNLGGRTLDCIPSALNMVSRIREQVGEAYPVALDCGIERGTDIFKALALVGVATISDISPAPLVQLK